MLICQRVYVWKSDVSMLYVFLHWLYKMHHYKFFIKNDIVVVVHEGLFRCTPDELCKMLNIHAGDYDPPQLTAGMYCNKGWSRTMMVIWRFFLNTSDVDRQAVPNTTPASTSPRKQTDKNNRAREEHREELCIKQTHSIMDSGEYRMKFLQGVILSLRRVMYLESTKLSEWSGGTACYGRA